jgi:hypothetical protein
MRLTPVLLILCLLGCSSSPYKGAPRYLMPETRVTAARHLNEAMAFEGVGYAEVWADEGAIRWQERRRRERRVIWLERELRFDALRHVYRAGRRGEIWEVKVDATGGALTLRFRTGEAAGKAEAALRRLRQPN